MLSREFTPLAVELHVEDIEAAVCFYSEKLGFEVVRVFEPEAGPPVFAVVALGEAIVMFMLDHFYAGPRAQLDEHGAGVDIRVMVPDVDAVYERVRAADMDLMLDIGDREYGLRDFIARDPFGFRLRFAAPLGDE